MFPAYYHAHHSRSMEDLPFWLGLAKQQAGPILELGCGSGRVLVPLLQAGQAVTGLDNDAAMLVYLRQRLPPKKRSTLQVFAADLSAFHLSRRFSLIILPCNTWSTLDAQNRKRALGCIRKHLGRGGVFAVSLPNPALYADLPARSALQVEEEYEQPDLGGVMRVSSGWQRSRRHFTVTWRYEHQLPDGSWQQLDAHAAHSLDPAEQYLDELADAGLRLEALYGDFDQSPYNEQALNLIIIARR